MRSTDDDLLYLERGQAMNPTDQELVKELAQVFPTQGALKRGLKRFPEVVSERDRMAAALAKIAAMGVPDYTDFGESYDEIRDIARSAIAESPSATKNLAAPPADSKPDLVPDIAAREHYNKLARDEQIAPQPIWSLLLKGK